jgi:CheY-like chemotaxis protein
VRTARFIVAEADPEIGKEIVAFLNRSQISAECVQDGGQALLQIHRKRPDGVVLGGHLPGLSAAALCEIVRRTAELAEVRLVRVHAPDEPAAAAEFEADHVVQLTALPEGLGAILGKLGLGQPAEPAPAPAASPARPAASAPRREPRPSPEPPRAPAAAPVPRAVPPQPAAAPAGADPRVAAAERLARIIVSDIILYNEAKFRAAAAQGNVTAALEQEIAEASALFRQRVPEEVRSTRNFLADELESRATRLRS